MDISPFVVKAAQWLLSKTGDSLFDFFKQRLLERVGLRSEPPLTTAKATALLDEYLRRLEDRLAQRVIDRLDEDRLGKLLSAFKQLERSSKTALGRDTLGHALNSFSEIASLPEQGKTGDFQNAELRCLAFLGIAAVHIVMTDPQSEIAKNIAEAIYTDFPTAAQWLDEAKIRKLFTQGANLTFHSDSSYTIALAWLPSGPCIAAGYQFGEVRVWDMTTGKHITTYRGHSDCVITVAWSPDGRYIASGSKDKTAQIWDALTGKHLLTYHGHSGELYKLAWSPNGTCIASTSQDKTMQVWDANTAHRITSYSAQVDVNWVVAWSPDSTYIVSKETNNELLVLKVATGERLATYSGHSNIVHAAAWSPDGKNIASGDNDKTVQVWDARTGNPIITYRGHTDLITEVVWSPGGARIASSSKDETIIWDVASGQSIFTRVIPNNLMQVTTGTRATMLTWSPDGTTIASNFVRSAVSVRDATTGNPIITYRGHSDMVRLIAWSSDGKYIATSSGDEIQTWDAMTGRHMSTYHDHSAIIRAMVWSANSLQVTSRDDKDEVHIWNAQTGKCENVCHASSKVVALSPRGTRFVTFFADNSKINGDREAQVWDATTGTQISSYRGHPDGSAYSLHVAWSPDDARIASFVSLKDKSVQVWDARTGHNICTYLGLLKLWKIAWSPDGTRIASTYDDRTVQVWNATAGFKLRRKICTHRWHSRFPNYAGHDVSLAWSPDGNRIVSVLNSKIAEVWDSTTAKHISTYRCHSPCRGFSNDTLFWSTDGSYVAVEDYDDNIQVWDAHSGDHITTFHTKYDEAWKWSPYDNHIAATSWENVVEIWQAP